MQMLHLIVRTKIGDTIAITHQGDMNAFMQVFNAMRCITTPAGVWVPMENISHIVPQVVPQVPQETLGQTNTEAETRQ